MGDVPEEINVANNNIEEKSTNDNGTALCCSLSTSDSSLASSSGASVKSGIPKLLGVKPASHSGTSLISQSSSRIGRLCGNQHKPAVPTSPVKSSKFYGISKLINSLFKVHGRKFTSLLIMNI